MRKSIIGAVAVVAIAVAGIVNVNLNASSQKLSDVALANVEALADESGGSSKTWPCWAQDKSSSGGYWRCGIPCIWVDSRKGAGSEALCYN